MSNLQDLIKTSRNLRPLTGSRAALRTLFDVGSTPYKVLGIDLTSACGLEVGKRGSELSVGVYFESCNRDSIVAYNKILDIYTDNQPLKDTILRWFTSTNAGTGLNMSQGKIKVYKAKKAGATYKYIASDYSVATSAAVRHKLYHWSLDMSHLIVQQFDENWELTATEKSFLVLELDNLNKERDFLADCGFDILNQYHRENGQEYINFI